MDLHVSLGPKWAVPCLVWPSCCWGCWFLGPGPAVPGLGMSPQGQFARRHRGDLMPLLLLQCGLSALCDAVPERESTALVRRGVAESRKIFVRTSAFLLLPT